MSTHNIGFYEDLTKIIFELSSYTHLISSAVGFHSNPLHHVRFMYLLCDLYVLLNKYCLNSISCS